MEVFPIGIDGVTQFQTALRARAIPRSAVGPCLALSFPSVHPFGGRQRGRSSIIPCPDAAVRGPFRRRRVGVGPSPTPAAMQRAIPASARQKTAGRPYL